MLWALIKFICTCPTNPSSIDAILTAESHKRTHQSSHLLHRPEPLVLLLRQPLGSTRSRRSSSAKSPPLAKPRPGDLLPMAPRSLLPRAFAVAVAQLLQHREAPLHGVHGVLEGQRVRQPAHVFGRQAQAVLEVRPREAEGLEGGALGGQAGLLDGAWGRRRGTVVDLLAGVLFFYCK